MAKLPTVAIIGRPNTGKSTLFNRLVGARRSIVSDIPGTTRDPVVQRVEGEQLSYLLMDTGGMGGGTEDIDFEDDVEAQSLLALEHADLILFLVSGREEITAADHAVVQVLRKKHKKHVSVFLIVTKCDDPQKMEELLPQFYELGIGDKVFSVSATQRLGTDLLAEEIEEKLLEMHFKKEESEDGEEHTVPRIALVGRPNVGKSSLINALMSDPQRKVQARMVSDVPGTTRDTTDTVITFKGREFLFLDTAGLRRKSHVEGEIEIFATFRTIQAIEDADVTVLVLDAVEGIGRQDKRIANLAVERGTGLILLVNKADQLDAEKKEAFREEIERSFQFCRYAPVLLTSAITRENLPKLFDMITMIVGNRARRIETPLLNRWFQDTVTRYQPNGIGGLNVKTRYITQASINPPTFVLFLNDPRRLHFSTVRFMENKLRDAYALEGTPVRWVKKGRDEE